MDIRRMNCEIGLYAEALFSAKDLNGAFAEFEKEIQRLGFDGALYTYIPDLVLLSNGRKKPVYQLSESYVPNYVSHYQDARYDKADPLIKAVVDGVSVPIDWSGNICKIYMSRNRKSREVIQESRSYGVRQAITLPLKSDLQGIAGASFIMTESCSVESPVKRIQELCIISTMYHKFVMANASYLGSFVRPVFGNLNDLEIRFLAGMASGKSLKELAVDLCRSKKYLEQVLMTIRTKVGGQNADGKSRINRDQLMFYAGLVNIIGLANELHRG